VRPLSRADAAARPVNLDAEVVLGDGRRALLRELLPEHEWPAPLPR
jgi:hypothetical protein